MYLCQENVHSVPENQKFVFREVSMPACFGVCLFFWGQLEEKCCVLGGREWVGGELVSFLIFILLPTYCAGHIISVDLWEKYSLLAFNI